MSEERWRKEIKYITDNFSNGFLVTSSKQNAITMSSYLEKTDGFKREFYFCPKEEKEFLIKNFSFVFQGVDPSNGCWVIKIDLKQFEHATIHDDGEEEEETKDIDKEIENIQGKSTNDLIKTRSFVLQTENTDLANQVCYGGMFCDGCTSSKMKLDPFLKDKVCLLKDKTIDYESINHSKVDGYWLLITHSKNDRKLSNLWIPKLHSISVFEIKKEKKLIKLTDSLRKENRSYFVYWLTLDSSKLVDKSISELK